MTFGWLKRFTNLKKELLSSSLTLDYVSKWVKRLWPKFWALHLSLLLGSLIRINVISFVYGILVLAAPFLPVSRSRILSWYTKRYIQSVLITGLMSGIAQITFQVVLLADPPYGRDFTNCHQLEKLGRQFGFQRLDLANFWNLIRLISPEVLVCAAAIHTYVKCTDDHCHGGIFDHFLPELLMDQLEFSPVSQLTEEALKPKSEEVSEGEKWRAWLTRKRLQHYFAAMNDVAIATLLGAAGIVHPCLFSAPYFAIYILLAGNWAANRGFKDRYWWMIRKWACVYSAIHLIMLYLYQFPFLQEAIPPDCFAARFIGMTAIIIPNCENPSFLVFTEAKNWPLVLNPFILMAFYGISSVQLRIYFGSCEEEIISEIEERVPKLSQATTMRPIMISGQPPLRYAVTKPPPWATEALRAAKRSLSSLAERTTISRSSTLESLKDLKSSKVELNSVAKSDELEQSNRLISRSTLEKSPHSERLPKDVNWEDMEAGEPLLSGYRTRRQPVYMPGGMVSVEGAGAFTTVTQFIKSQSYVVSLFMMMAWSITYHSWSTFVLLLVACCVWMVPDSRTLCLRLSPFVAVYANVLLVVQFIWGMNLTESELPDEHPIIMRQLGFEKPRLVPPCVPLFIKCTFTIMFSITLRQHLQEKTQRRQSSMEEAMLSVSPFHVAFTPVSRRRSSAPARRPSGGSMESKGSRKFRERSMSILKDPAAKVKQFGGWFRALVAKYWVLINICLLLFISLRSPVVIYRVIYMAFFMAFVNCFQISFPLWRKLLYSFWMLMVVYCMTVLTLIYTYQFHGLPEMWESGTGWSHEVFSSLGLEKYSSGELFIKLLTPISFLIFTLVQVNFFHKDLMDRTLQWQQAVYPNAFSRTSSIFRRATLVSRTVSKSVSRSMSSTTRIVKKRIVKRSTDQKSLRSIQSAGSVESQPEADENKNEVVGPKVEKDTDIQSRVLSSARSTPERKRKRGPKSWIAWIEETSNKIAAYQDRMANLAWRLTEIHIKKVISLKMMWICVNEISACNIPYMISIAITLPFENLDVIAGHLLGVWSSCVIVLKMLYQMKFIKVSDIVVKCATVPGVNGTVYSPSFPFHENTSADSAHWFGFWKTVDIYNDVQGHLTLIILLAFRTVCQMRQTLHRKGHKEFKPLRAVLLPKITRLDADEGLPNCLMYLANYFFYKFGLEICFISTVITVGTRADFVSIFYSLSLIGLLTMRRKKVAKIWPYYVTFLAAMLPLQYILCVGIPPSLCSSYPWTQWDNNLIEWLYLPDFAVAPNPQKLTADFFQLMCATCQWYVFNVEIGNRATDYPGGQNTEIVYHKKQENSDNLESPTSAQPLFNGVPVPDYISYSKSYLDMIKNVLFIYFYWATLAVVFVAGTSRVTLFAMGYVIGCFGFLWVGNELFLKPLRFALKLWNALVLYNVIIIFLKTSLQVVGCVYVAEMYRNYCWVLQLFGIACLKPGFDPSLMVDSEIMGECKVPHKEAGIYFDGICFIFLLIQRRIFSSYYFQHVIAEFKAQQIFASRGAELINMIRTKDIADEQKKQDEIVKKVTSKMEKILQRERRGGAKSSKVKKSGSRTERHHKPSTKRNQQKSDGQEVLSVQSASSQSKGPSPQIMALQSDDQESISFPVDAFDDQPVPESLRNLLETSPIQEGRPHSLLLGNRIASPTHIRANGVFASIAQMQKCSETVPVVSMDDVAPRKELSPDVAPCHIIGPNILPSPDSQNYVPFLTSPTEPILPNRYLDRSRKRSVAQVAAIKAAEEHYRKKSDGKRKRSIPEYEAANEHYRKKSDDRRKFSIPEYEAIKPTASNTKPEKYRPRVRTMSLERLSRSGSDEEVATDSQYSSHSDIGTHFEESAQDKKKDEDRRKGLGPLQLLNVAFKKGAIKHAVKESKEMEKKEGQMEKQMLQTFGHSDHKAIRRHLFNRKSRKAKPDFKEEGFEEEPIMHLLDSGSKMPIPSMRRLSTANIQIDLERDEKEMHLEGEDDLIPPEYDDVMDREHLMQAEAELAADILEEKHEQKEDLESTEVSEEIGANKIKLLIMAGKEYLNNALMFFHLFGVGALESVITWLLRFSRDYRYVAQVLSVEKRAQKEFMTYKPAEVEEDEPTDKIPPEELKRKLGPTAFGSFMGDENMVKLHKYLQTQDPTLYSLDDGDEGKFSKDQNIFVRLFAASYFLLISRSELFCYLMIVLNHMSSASFLTSPLPMMTFLWGTLSIPRPSKMFWVTVITYTEAMVITKYLFQFGFFPWNKVVPDPDPFYEPRILGILKSEKYALWDLLLLMTLFFHRGIMKTLGLWNEESDDIQPEREDSKDRILRSLSRHESKLSKKSDGSLKKDESLRIESREKYEKYLALKEKLKDPAYAAYHYRKVKIKKGLITYAKQVIAFFRTLLNPVDRNPIDVYALQFLCDFICFLIVIFGYWAFGTDQGEGGVAAYFEENKVPGAFLAMLIVQFALIIIDRALFLRKFLMGKVVYQFALVIFVHFWIFFVLPGMTERLFVENLPVKLWYFTKCVYFCISAWQIRSGYPTRGGGNFLTKQYTLINWLLFKIFMTIPFLFELRTLMDWIWNDTSLGIGDWLKLSDIYSNIYLLKCERQFERDYPSPRGIKKRLLLKYGLGGVMLVAIILIIWFPLVLFSLANTVGVRSLPVDCTAKLSIGGYQVLYENSARQQNLEPISEKEYEKLEYSYRYSKYAQSYMADYGPEDIVRAVLEGNSSSIWTISPPAKQALLRHLNSDVDIILTFEWHFTRSTEGLDLLSARVGSENRIVLGPEHRVRKEMVEMLVGKRHRPIQIEHLFPPFVKVPGKGEAKRAMQLLEDRVPEGAPLNHSYYDVYLDLKQGTRSNMNGSVQWWQLQMLKKNWDPTWTKPRKPDKLNYLEIIGFSDKVFPATISFVTGGGIVGLYGTMALLVGRFIRSQITGSMAKIMYEELPNVDRILQLCLDIFLVREAGEFALEEDLFAKLIFLYRSPATLIKWTKEKIE